MSYLAALDERRYNGHFIVESFAPPSKEQNITLTIHERELESKIT